jgi:hypothetical protein
MPPEVRITFETAPLTANSEAEAASIAYPSLGCRRTGTPGRPGKVISVIARG